MDTFTITMLLTKKDYINYLFREIYKRPYSIFLTVLGLVLVATTSLQLLKIISIFYETPLAELGMGILLLLSPIISILIASKTYYSSPCLRDEIKYTFGQDEVIVKGSSFNTSFTWDHIIKSKEMGDFLLLYSSKKLANFIRKDKLSKEQLDFIKSKVGQR